MGAVYRGDQARHPKVIHLYKYTADGSGSRFLDIVSEIGAVVSQVVLTSMLLMIGLGYTLLQSKIGELDIIIPMAVLIGVFHILIVGVGKLRDDASTKFHENEGSACLSLGVCSARRSVKR